MVTILIVGLIMLYLLVTAVYAVRVFSAAGRESYARKFGHEFTTQHKVMGGVFIALWPIFAIELAVRAIVRKVKM